MKWHLIVGTALLSCTGAHAQVAPEQPQCWLAGLGYSPGATALAAGGVMECQSDFTWKATTVEASGCLYEGKLNAVGAVIIEGFADTNTPMSCAADGTWTTTE